MRDIGTDWSRGQSNIDHKTGIHYGVISMHEVTQTWCDSSEGVFEYYCPECSTHLKRGYDAKRCPACYRKIDPDYDFDMVDPVAFVYKGNGYVAEQTQYDPDIFILKSPYFTYCQFCSPCAPGAGYIMNSVEDGVKAYCFGHDWFEDQETGNMIECRYCKGTGLRNKGNIPNFKEALFKQYHFDDTRIYCIQCKNFFDTGNQGKVKEYIRKAPYKVYSVKTGKEIVQQLE
jgi:hypothetical protein